MSTKDEMTLNAILEAITKIEEYIKPFNNAFELFEHDLSFDGVLMNFIVIGEMTSRLSDNLKQSKDHIDWTKIKGLRNIIAHDYFGVDAEEVWQIATSKLNKLQVDIEKILL